MASFIDSLVADIRKVSEESEMKELAAKLISQEEQLNKVEVSMLDTIIECLDINSHTLGILAALLGKVQQEDKIADWSLFVRQMKQFSVNFDANQARQYLPSTFCSLFHQFTDVVCRKRRSRALEGILILQSAVLRYRKSPAHLTAIHADLVQLCLLAKNVKPCLSFLKQDFTSLQDEDHQFDSKYVLLYYYYGGMVFTCLHDYHQAMLFFTICVTTPSMAISAIMVAAFKKYILVSLLKYGKEMSLPRYSVHIVERALKPLCGPYIQLSRAFVSGKIDAVQAVVNKFQENFNNDGNASLIRRLVARVKKHSLQILTQTFMTVSMADVSTRLNFSSEQEAEKYIRDMIEGGEVHASLDQAKGMVSFEENPEHFDSLPMVQHMEGQLQHCMELQRKLAALDKDLTLDPRYIHRQLKSGMDDDPMFQDEPV